MQAATAFIHIRLNSTGNETHFTAREIRPKMQREKLLGTKKKEKKINTKKLSLYIQKNYHFAYQKITTLHTAKLPL